MKLRRIEFEGIRSFSEPTVFNFGRAPGLYFLQGGDNAQDPDLGSNGVGKSTIWSILCWILFGKTPDGLRAGDLKTWQGETKGYKGKLFIGRSVVERSWTPNKLTYDGRVVTQDELDDLVGITFDTFNATVLISQSEPMFFDLSAVKKLSIFTDLLDLDEWILHSIAAKDKTLLIQIDIQEKKVLMARVEGQLDGLDIEKIREKKENFRSERYNKMTTIQEDEKELLADLKKLTKRRNKSKRFRKSLAKKGEENVSRRTEIQKRFTDAKVEVAKATVELELMETAAKAFKDHADHMLTHKGKKCVQCGQTITERVAKKQRTELKRLEARAIEEYDLEKKAGGLLLQVCEDLENDWEDNTAAYRKLQKRIRQVEGEWEVMEEDYTQVKIAVKIAGERREKIHKEKNPYAAELAEKEAMQDRLIHQLERRKRTLDKLEARKELTEYWVKGFKDVRLYLIEEALKQLEVETNRALAELGFGSEWKIKYMIERTSKAGRSAAGFTVLVKSPYSDGHVPFATWSGGEKQRLKIAGSMGFMSLVSARTGLDLGLEVYDEPTQHLSPQGIDSLLEALRMRALETGKRIWLVDHHTLDYGEFISTAVVSKDVSGNSTVQQE